MRTKVAFALVAVVAVCAARVPRALGAVSRVSDSGEISILGQSGGGQTCFNNSRSGSNFLLFKPNPFNMGCSGVGGELSAESSQDTALRGSGTNLHGLTSEATASSSVTADGPIRGIGKAQLDLRVNVTG